LLTIIYQVTSSDLINRIKEVTKFPDETEANRIISGFKWIGLLSSQEVKPRAGNLLDTLCARLEELMKYEKGERDLVMLQHKFVVEWADGKQVRFHSVLFFLDLAHDLRNAGDNNVNT
jgi:spermidine synthase